MSECTHDCSTCGESCAERQAPPVPAEGTPSGGPHRQGLRHRFRQGWRRQIHGHQPVGCHHAAAGLPVGILDADVTGPSIPKAFGVHGQVVGSQAGLYPMTSRTGIQIMSTNLLLPNETDPVIWRGPVISGVVQQFWTDVLWNCDYLFVDMPPGTGDVSLSVFQSIPLDG